MCRESYIRSFLSESLSNEKDIKWSEMASDLDDMAYVIFANYTNSDEFRDLLSSDVGLEKIFISFSYPSQEDFIIMHNDKSNVGIEKIYDFSKNHLRKIKLMFLNEIE